MPRRPRVVDYAIGARERLERLSVVGSRAGVTVTYHTSQDAVLRAARAAIGRRNTLSGADARKLRSTLLSGQVRVAKLVQLQIQERRAHAARVATQGLVNLVNEAGLQVRAGFGARVQAVVNARQIPAIETALRERLGEWTVQSRARIEALLAEGADAAEILGDAALATDGAWAGMRRIVVTDTATAYNAAADAAVEVLSTEVGGVMKRWTELIDDVTGQPYDNRVAADSFAMHGQLAPPNGVFVMPSDERVSAKRWGMTFPYPPNRPFDRAVVAPWIPAWGVPGWDYANGRRVDRRLPRR